MPENDLKAFLERVAEDEALQEALVALRAATPPSEDDFASALVQMAADEGFSFSTDDVSAERADASKGYISKQCPECKGGKYFWEQCGPCEGYGEVTITIPPYLKTCPTCKGYKKTKTLACWKCQAYGWLWVWQD